MKFNDYISENMVTKKDPNVAFNAELGATHVEVKKSDPNVKYQATIPNEDEDYKGSNEAIDIAKRKEQIVYTDKNMKKLKDMNNLEQSCAYSIARKTGLCDGDFHSFYDTYNDELFHRKTGMFVEIK